MRVCSNDVADDDLIWLLLSLDDGGVIQPPSQFPLQWTHPSTSPPPLQICVASPSPLPGLRYATTKKRSRKPSPTCVCRCRELLNPAAPLPPFSTPPLARPNQSATLTSAQPGLGSHQAHRFAPAASSAPGSASIWMPQSSQKREVRVPWSVWVLSGALALRAKAGE